MCGIAGMVDWRAATPGDALRSISEAMIETVRHRGPDAGDVWVEAEGGVALGQRRLAIIDLSPGGAQPMHSADRRYVITFNGEIYNYRDIRRELEAAGRAMRSDSDTEVLLEACALWGVEAAIERDRHVCLRAVGPQDQRRPWRATASASSRSTTPRRRSACCSPRSSRLFVPIPNGNRRSMRMPSSVICAMPISLNRAQSIAKPRNLPPVTS